MNKWNLTDDYTKLESIYIKKLLDIVSSFPTKNGYIGNQIGGVEGGGSDGPLLLPQRKREHNLKT